LKLSGYIGGCSPPTLRWKNALEEYVKAVMPDVGGLT
jgi:hypothetical protein